MNNKKVGHKKKKVVQKASFKDAFNQIMEPSKKFKEDAPILSKYKKPAVKAEDEKREDYLLRLKKIATEKKRM